MENKIRELERRIKKLEGRRVLQQDIMPDVVKMRHVGEGVRFIRSGLAADLPTAETPLQGTPVYFATDTDTLYIWNGTAYVSEVLT